MLPSGVNLKALGWGNKIKIKKRGGLYFMIPYREQNQEQKNKSFILWFHLYGVLCALITQSCPICYDPMDCSHWAPLSFAVSWNLLTFMSIESVFKVGDPCIWRDEETAHICWWYCVCKSVLSLPTPQIFNTRDLHLGPIGVVWHKVSRAMLIRF